MQPGLDNIADSVKMRLNMRYNHERKRWEINRWNPLDWLAAAFDSEAWDDVTGTTDARNEALSEKVASQYVDPNDPPEWRWHFAQCRALRACGFNREARMAEEIIGQGIVANFDEKLIYKRRLQEALAKSPRLSRIMREYEEQEKEQEKWQNLIREARARDEAEGFGRRKE